MTDHRQHTETVGYDLLTSCSCGEQFGNDDQASYRWLEHAHGALLELVAQMQTELNAEHAARIEWEAKADYWHNSAATYVEELQEATGRGIESSNVTHHMRNQIRALESEVRCLKGGE
ncbi:MAG: hypothetical protein JWO62_2554 [Acidimicrobiaceae bacterium]|nr:hypothetical protein [Acidimicrobiaceae bacterium]